MSTPTSKIYVCSGVRLNNSYEHTIWFDSEESQLAYFSGKVATTFSDYTYLRKNWDINVKASMEAARSWSYLYFRNGTGKHYFYFITNLQYINDGMVRLSIELDVMQTYMFDYTLLRSFVEREHVADDTVGKHIIDEGLELGDLRVIDEVEINLQNLCVLVQATYNPLNTTEENTDTVLAAKYNNVFSGLGIYAVSLSDWQAWGTKLKLLDDYGKSDGIIAMWMYPQDLVTLTSGYTWTDGNVCKPVSGISSFYKDVARNTKTSGAYTPKNNKLLTYPFNFLYVSNNNGAAAAYRFERFGDPAACNFRVIGTLSPEGSVRLYPLNYNGLQHNYEEGLQLGDYPTCAWNQDIYKLWLAQNQNSQAYSNTMAGLKIAAGAVTAGIGAVTGNLMMAAGGASSVAMGAADIHSLLAQKADIEIQPPQAKGVHSSSVSVANGFHTFAIKWKSIGIEQAAVIDDFFSMYGYKIHRVKVPNRNVRENWTYTKTIGCHITGNFCNEDLVKIESIYNNGITFWNNGDSIGNYNLSNNTI